MSRAARYVPAGTPEPQRGPQHGPHGRPGRAFASLRPFRNRAFTLLWTAGLISTVGSWMQTVAVGALVIARYRKATWAVVVAAGAFLPIGLLSPVGGALADRLPRRPPWSSATWPPAVIALLHRRSRGHGRDGPGVLMPLVTLQGSASALIRPFQQAILPDLVPRPEFLAAMSLNSAQFNLGRIMGPALAGGTVAAFGYPVAFVANAVSFLAVVMALAFMRLAPPAGRTDGVRVAAFGCQAARGEPGAGRPSG